MTRNIVLQLRRQILRVPLTITVIDDGSSDGTTEFLLEQGDINTIRGDGELWWGGAIDVGLQKIFRLASEDDWVLFLNDDTELRPDFIQTLLDVAHRHAPAAVGSVVRDIEYPHSLILVGPHINPWTFTVKDMKDVFIDLNVIVPVDALSGRGVIYPLKALRVVNGMRPRMLPHYLADYELSLRVRAHGFRLLVTTDAAVYSSQTFGSTYKFIGIFDRLFSVRSPVYLPAYIAFWWQASGRLARITLPFRLVFHFLWRQFRTDR